MYDEANGPPYSESFIADYRAAQVARNHRITDWCYAELERLKTHGMADRAFNLYRTWADLRLMDHPLTRMRASRGGVTPVIPRQPISHHEGSV